MKKTIMIVGLSVIASLQAVKQPKSTTTGPVRSHHPSTVQLIQDFRNS